MSMLSWQAVTATKAGQHCAFGMFGMEAELPAGPCLWQQEGDFQWLYHPLPMNAATYLVMRTKYGIHKWQTTCFLNYTSWWKSYLKIYAIYMLNRSHWEKKEFSNNKVGYPYYLKQSYHKKCKTSFPFLIGNFCMGLLPHQRWKMYLQVCTSSILFPLLQKCNIYCFFWIQILFLNSNIAQRAKEIG